MLSFLKAILLLPVAVAAVLLAVANRAPVTLSLDPISKGVPEFSLTLPFYAWIFIAVALGVVIGGMGAWMAQSKHRRARREYGREVHRLRAEAERLRARPASSNLPALPAR